VIRARTCSRPCFATRRRRYPTRPR
jgi:hypothetical protein